MADNQRTRRVAEFVQREISQILLRQVKDPRVRNLNISAVHVNRDLSVAKIFYTLLDLDLIQADAEQKQQHILQAQNGLEKATGFIRSLLARSLHMRSVPKLVFLYDESVDRAEKMTRLIEQAIAADAVTQQQHLERDKNDSE